MRHLLPKKVIRTVRRLKLPDDLMRRVRRLGYTIGATILAVLLQLWIGGILQRSSLEGRLNDGMIIGHVLAAMLIGGLTVGIAVYLDSLLPELPREWHVRGATTVLAVVLLVLTFWSPWGYITLFQFNAGLGVLCLTTALVHTARRP